MLAPITIRFPVAPARRSLATAEVAALFGLADTVTEPLTVADNLVLDVRPGDVALFTGASGSGKSSLLRAVGEQLGAVDVAALTLPGGPLVDALPGVIPDRLGLLSACGLAEPRLMLRAAAELSDGQRARFRVAFALATRPGVPLLLDEFGAVLDRPLAKVLAFNLRKLAARTGTGVLAATTHDDLADDLCPDVHVRCHGDGRVDVERSGHAGFADRGCRSPPTFGCRTVPSRIGRTSRGGITAGTASGSSSA